MSKIFKIKGKTKKKEKKKTVFFIVLFLTWFSLSKADFSGPNLIQDRDGDGLTDAEELAFGTDLDNPDSDGDGYSDGVEVRSGYDPLKPSPGDRLVNIQGEKTKKISEDENNSLSKTKENLTDKYFEELSKEKGDYLSALRLAVEGNKDAIQEENLGRLSLTEDDISNILERVSNGAGLSKEEVTPVLENEIVIIPKPKGSPEEVKTKEKEQIKKYVTTLGYFLVTRAPFQIENEKALVESGGFFVEDVASALLSGNLEKLRNLREKNKEVFKELKKIEVPECIKDVHLKILYLYKYFLEGVNEETLINQKDPVAMMLELGKLQTLMLKAQEVSEQLDNIFSDYEIENFSGEGLF